MTAQRTYDMIADFIASMNPQKILKLKAHRTLQDCSEDLPQQEK